MRVVNTDEPALAVSMTGLACVNIALPDDPVGAAALSQISEPAEVLAGTSSSAFVAGSTAGRALDGSGVLANDPPPAATLRPSALPTTATFSRRGGHRGDHREARGDCRWVCGESDVSGRFGFPRAGDEEKPARSCCE